MYGSKRHPKFSYDVVALYIVCRASGVAAIETVTGIKRSGPIIPEEEILSFRNLELGFTARSSRKSISLVGCGKVSLVELYERFTSGFFEEHVTVFDFYRVPADSYDAFDVVVFSVIGMRLDNDYVTTARVS